MEWPSVRNLATAAKTQSPNARRIVLVSSIGASRPSTWTNPYVTRVISRIFSRLSTNRRGSPARRLRPSPTVVVSEHCFPYDRVGDVNADP